MARHSDLLDEVLRGLYSSRIGEDRCCIVATGGYGRRDLFPASDIDLLILVPDHRVPEIEAPITRFLQELWDLRLRLGQQVWTLDQLEEINCKEHLGLILALIDRRKVTGDDTLYRTFEENWLNPFWKVHRVEIARQIGLLVNRRHDQHERTLYHLEPDIKETPGGLRDYLAGRWLETVTAAATFLPFGRSEIEASHAFLQRLRIFLHVTAGRDYNRLTHRLQEEYCRATEADLPISEALVGLMSRYYRSARRIYRFCRRRISTLEKDEDSPEALEREDLIPLSGLDRILEAFARLLEEQRPLADSARNAIIENLKRIEKQDVPSLAQVLTRIFQPRAELYDVLSEMHELGVLNAVVPEFKEIDGLVTRDFYHQYTVDEHSIRAVANLGNLAGGQGDGRFVTLLQEVEEPALLGLTLLLHDIGKGRSGDHSRTGADIAARRLPALGFDPEEVKEICFLIRHHLALSTVVFRRDMDDRPTTNRFADLIGSVERLRLLTLVTYCDMAAVSRQTLNAWRIDLMWQFYVSIYRQLTLGYGQKRIGKGDLSGRLTDHFSNQKEKEAFQQFLEGFPRRYLVTTPATEVYRHFRMASRLHQGSESEVRLRWKDNHCELWVATRDRERLFSRIAGLLAYFDMNVLKAVAFSNEAGMVLDVFQFDDIRKVFKLNPEEVDRFQHLLKEAIADRLDVRELLRRKEKGFSSPPPVASVEPSIYFEDDEHNDCTILEIVAPDSLGLLYRISREIAAAGCDIDLALISTEGARAVDVFYLTVGESKLSAGRKEALERALLSILDDRTETGESN